MTLTEFYEALRNHDWYYDWSDDAFKWHAGDLDRRRFKKIALESPDHQKLFDMFEAHYFSGQIFGTVKKPRPEKPKDDV